MPRESPGDLVSHDRRQAEAWALALASQDIHSRIEHTPAGWRLVVPARQAERAARVIDSYERENPLPAEPAPRVPEFGATGVAIAIAALFTAFFLVTGPRDGAVPWFRVGAADAERILAGEWWRTITALTLHADLAHVLGNAFFFAIFGTAVCRSLGPGLGTCLILASGVLGNAITAVIRGPLHSSVGASTAIFGAIGLLAGVQLARWRRPHSGRRTRWLPLAAALGLLAMIGMSKRADLAAHASGLAAGVPLGLVSGAFPGRLPGVTLQRLLLAGVTGFVSLAWALALS